MIVPNTTVVKVDVDSADIVSKNLQVAGQDSPAATESTAASGVSADVKNVEGQVVSV